MAEASEVEGGAGGAPCQDIALIFWALGTPGIVCRALPAAPSTVARQRAPQRNPQNLSNVAWASSSLQRKGRPLLAATGKGVLCPPCRHLLGPQEAANVAREFGTPAVYDAALLDVLLDASKPRIHELDAQELSNALR